MVKEKSLAFVRPDGSWIVKTPKPGKADALKAFYAEHGYTFKKAVTVPGLRSLENMSSDGVAKAIDGCRVEPDGTCSHGSPSWLMALGYI